MYFNVPGDEKISICISKMLKKVVGGLTDWSKMEKIKEEVCQSSNRRIRLYCVDRFYTQFCYIFIEELCYYTIIEGIAFLAQFLDECNTGTIDISKPFEVATFLKDLYFRIKLLMFRARIVVAL